MSKPILRDLYSDVLDAEQAIKKIRQQVRALMRLEPSQAERFVEYDFWKIAGRDRLEYALRRLPNEGQRQYERRLRKTVVYLGKQEWKEMLLAPDQLEGVWRVWLDDLEEPGTISSIDVQLVPVNLPTWFQCQYRN